MCLDRVRQGHLTLFRDTENGLHWQYMANQQDRLERERRTIQTMIGIYCRGHHHSQSGLCAGCVELSGYAMERIAKCPFVDDKPTCAKCPIHCYKPDMREQVRRVMRYAGPRMMLYHPILTFWHYYDELSRKQMDRQRAIERMRASANRKSQAGDAAPEKCRNAD